MEQVSKYLGLVKPGFCIASCLSTGDIVDDLHEHLYKVLYKELGVFGPANVPLDADRQRQQDFLLELSEQCYVSASGPVGDTEEERARIAASAGKRRREVNETLAFFAASGGGRLRHACPAGCCGPVEEGPASDRARSVRKSFDLVKHFVTPCISEPAANKYMKVNPVMRKLAFMTNFHNLLRKAIGLKLGVTAAVSDAESDISVDDAVVVPTNTTAHWRKVKHIKLNRSFNFLKKRSCAWLPFKYGTWYSHRRTKDRRDIFDFSSDLLENPIAEVLSTLASMKVDPEHWETASGLIVAQIRRRCKGVAAPSPRASPRRTDHRLQCRLAAPLP